MKRKPGASAFAQCGTKKPFVVLAVDPGARSGFAVATVGGGELQEVLRIGVTQRRDALQRVQTCQFASDFAQFKGLPLVVVAERWAANGMTGLTLSGLGEAWGEWREALRHTGNHDEPVRAYPQEWRKPLKIAQRPAAAAKAGAQRFAAQYMGITMLVDDDIADAVCLLAWAAQAPQPVLDSLGKRYLNSKD